MRGFTLFLAIVAVGAFGQRFTPSQVGVLPDGTRYVKGHLLVGYDGPVTVGQRLFGGIVLRSYPEIRSVLLDYGSKTNILAVASRIQAQVRYAEPDRIYRGADHIPNDPDWQFQWGADRIDCPKAWDLGQGSSSVVIAIIDSGVNYNHLDLAGHYAGGFDYVDGDNDPMDVDGHGTHVAGITAAVADNSIGIAGVGFNCRFMALRVGTANAYPESLIVAGINYAIINGAQVINLSLGSYGDSSGLSLAIANAAAQGVVVCAAAGNDSTTQQFYPAAYNQCIAVAATGSDNNLASFANRGSWVDLGAPGTGIYSTDMNGGYSYKSGSSMACPIAAGTAALVYSALGGIRSVDNAAQVRGALLETSIPFTSEIGGGRLNAYQAVLQRTTVLPIWQTSHGDLDWSAPYPNEIMTTPDGLSAVSLFLVRTSGGASQQIAKFDGSGDLQWGVRTERTSGSSCLVMPNSGAYVYVLTQSATDHHLHRHSLVDGSADLNPTVATGMDSGPVDGVADSMGNIVVVSTSLAPALVVYKIDNLGNPLWSQSYANGFNSVKALSVKIDSSDNVYALARSRKTGGRYEFLLVKYSSSGVFQWAKSWAGPDVLDDLAMGLGVGGNYVGMSGLLSTTGLVQFPEGASTGARLFDLSGNQQFSDEYSSSSAEKYRSGGIDVASDGTCFVSVLEEQSGIGNLNDLVLRSLTSSGSLLWKSRVLLPDIDAWDWFCTAPKRDSNGNIYVAVFVATTIGLWDSILIKFRPDGVLEWSGRFQAGDLDNGSRGELFAILADGTVVLTQAGDFGNGTVNRVLGYNVPGGGNTNTGTMGGHIDLDQYNGSGDIVGEIEFREPGTTVALATQPITLDENGNYSTLPVAQGQYDVSVKFDNWLRQTIHGVAVTAAPTALDFSLINGDATNDNGVNLPDLNQIFVNFALSRNDADPGSDLDWDGIVGLPDINIVFINFGMVGDP